LGSPEKTKPHVSLEPDVSRPEIPIDGGFVSYAFVHRHFADRAMPAIIAGWDVTTLNSFPVALYAAAITSVSRAMPAIIAGWDVTTLNNPTKQREKR
jgi:hypothetical protein